MPLLNYSGSVTRRITASVLVLLFTTVLVFAAAQETPSWKRYVSSEYGFEINYPADWKFLSYDNPPSPGQHPAHAEETRSLFGLEMEGPTQSRDGGGSFDDGAIIDVRITGTSGIVEDSNIKPGPSTPSEWVKRQTSLGPGNGLKTMAVDANGFTGVIKAVCIGSNRCEPFEEEGAVYRLLPSGRVLLVTWDREVGSNDFSYQKYFLPMLSTFKLLN